MVKNFYIRPDEVWKEEQYEEYMKEIYRIKFIAGFTENGVPYGTFADEDNENDKLTIDSDDELPF